jgi:hypothetical protein
MNIGYKRETHIICLFIIALSLFLTYSPEFEGQFGRNDHIFVLSDVYQQNPLRFFYERSEMYEEYYVPVLFLSVYFQQQLFSYDYSAFFAFNLILLLLSYYLLYLILIRLVSPAMATGLILLHFSHLYVMSIITWTTVPIGFGVVVYAPLLWLLSQNQWLENKWSVFVFVGTVIFSPYSIEYNLVILPSLILYSLYFAKSFKNRLWLISLVAIALYTLAYVWLRSSLTQTDQAIFRPYPDQLPQYLYTVLAGFFSNFFPLFDATGAPQKALLWLSPYVVIGLIHLWWLRGGQTKREGFLTGTYLLGLAMPIVALALAQLNVTISLVAGFIFCLISGLAYQVGVPTQRRFYSVLGTATVIFYGLALWAVWQDDPIPSLDWLKILHAAAWLFLSLIALVILGRTWPRMSSTDRQVIIFCSLTIVLNAILFFFQFRDRYRVFSQLAWLIICAISLKYLPLAYLPARTGPFIWGLGATIFITGFGILHLLLPISPYLGSGVLCNPVNPKVALQMAIEGNIEGDLEYIYYCQSRNPYYELSPAVDLSELRFTGLTLSQEALIFVPMQGTFWHEYKDDVELLAALDPEFVPLDTETLAAIANLRLLDAQIEAQPAIDDSRSAAWRASKLPCELKALGADYLLVNSPWLLSLSEDEFAILEDPQYYRLITTWHFDRLTPNHYYFYQALGQCP